MGGSKSEEFLVPAAVGEDTFITTPSGYAVNVEAFRDQNGNELSPEAIAALKDGDIASNGEPITLNRGIELGHIFQLGQKYAQAYNWSVQVQDGSRVTPTMGSYGIGVSRILATIAELSCDEKGLVWPRNLSPYDFHIVLAVDNPKVKQSAAEITKQLTQRGYSILSDDRSVSAGIKFKDADLIGISNIIIVGNLIKDHKIELKSRATSSTEVLTLDQLYSKF
jgi:prolyl-tRNA synthetase